MDVSRLSGWLQAHQEGLLIGLSLGLFALVAGLERIMPFRRAAAGAARRWAANLTLTALNLVTLAALPISFIGAAHWARAREIGWLNVWDTPPWLALGVTLLLRAFTSYSSHWLMHRVPLLWRIHRVHHFDTALDVSSTMRFHPLEFPVGIVLGLPVVLAAGLTPWVLVAYELLNAAVTLLAHSNLRLPPSVEQVLRYLIVTPGLHRIHHSIRQSETDSNFSAVFPVWDLILGTFRTATHGPQASMKLGLEEVRDERIARIGWLLRSPFLRRLVST